MKMLSSVYKILPIILYFFISTLPVQAFSFPSSQPTGEISGGKFNQILTNILSDCGEGNYIQGFTSTGVADCKSVASFSTLTLASGNTNTTSGSALFQKYFAKILNNCGIGRYVRGFDSNKNLICEDIAKTVTLMGTTTSLVSPVSASFPSTPSGQRPGGAFTDSFNTIFATDCGAGKYLRGFDASKNKICNPIITIVAISNCMELQNIGTNTGTLSDNYYLTNDIDCSATNPLNPGNTGSMWDKNIANDESHFGSGGLGFKSIGLTQASFIMSGITYYYFGTVPFTGKFDGNGHKITGLSINRPSTHYVGLFSSASGATIKNIGLDGANIKGGPYLGGLAGSNTSSPISNSYIINSEIIGSSSHGGLVGINTSSPISNSYATNNIINGSSSAGGLVGGNYDSSITYSYAINNAINGSSSLGGLVGFNYTSSPISNSYATNNSINGSSSVGGLVGGSNYPDYSPISNSYATNNIIYGSSSVGGLVGSNSASISNSYSTNNRVNGVILVGGFAGSNSSTINLSYYNKDTFTGATSYGTPKTTREMITQGTYTSWDFSADWKPITGALAEYYPCLAWQANSTCTKVIDLQPPTITQVLSISNNCNYVMGKIDGYADNYKLNSVPYSFDGGVSWNMSPYFIPPLDNSSTYPLTPSSYTIKVKVRDAAGNIYSNPGDTVLSTNCTVSPEYGPFTFTEATTKCASLGAGWHVPSFDDFLMGFWTCTEKPLSGGINCKYPSSFTNGYIYWGSDNLSYLGNMYKEAFSPGRGWNGFEGVFSDYSYARSRTPVINMGLYLSPGNMMLRCVNRNNPFPF